MKITIPGQPVAKGRPRLTMAGYAYTPPKTVEYENLVKLCWMEQTDRETFPAGLPLQVDIKAYFQIPKSYSRRKHQTLDGSYYPKRPDADNIIKSVLDSLNGLAYADDSEIVKVSAVKRYTSGTPRTEVELSLADSGTG